jgi:hypothetical protein
VPAPAGAAPRQRPALGRGHRRLAAVQELQHQHEHLVPDRADGDHQLRSGRRAAAAGRRRRLVVGVEAAEELAEEEAARGEDAAVGVHEAALDAEGDVAEGLAVDQQVEVVHRERLEGVVGAHDLMCSYYDPAGKGERNCWPSLLEKIRQIFGGRPAERKTGRGKQPAATVVEEEGTKKRLAVAAAMVREDCGRRWAINRRPLCVYSNGTLRHRCGFVVRGWGRLHSLCLQSR